MSKPISYLFLVGSILFFSFSLTACKRGQKPIADKQPDPNAPAYTVEPSAK